LADYVPTEKEEKNKEAIAKTLDFEKWFKEF